MFIFPSKVNVKIKFRYFTNDYGLARIYFQSCRNGLALQYTLVTTIIDISKVHPCSHAKVETPFCQKTLNVTLSPLKTPIATCQPNNGDENTYGTS